MVLGWGWAGGLLAWAAAEDRSALGKRLWWGVGLFVVAGPGCPLAADMGMGWSGTGAVLCTWLVLAWFQNGLAA